MKKFKFRLEKVLHNRELVKDEKRRELLKRNQALQEAVNRLAELEKLALSNELEQQKVLSIGQVLLHGLFSERIKEEIINQRQVIETCKEEVAKAMSEYIEASKEAKSLETLRERKLQEYTEYIRKEDEKFLDELAVQRGGPR